MKREHIEDARINAYLDVLDQKSQRLKTLIEDLVEASKASSGNVKLEFTDIDSSRWHFRPTANLKKNWMPDICSSSSMPRGTADDPRRWTPPVART